MEEREEGDAHNIYALSVPIAELRKGKRKWKMRGYSPSAYSNKAPIRTLPSTCQSLKKALGGGGVFSWMNFLYRLSVSLEEQTGPYFTKKLRPISHK